MSGSIPGPDKQEPSTIDLQLIEDMQSDDPNVVARATQRLAQNDPRYAEPQMPQTTTPGAAGLREEDLGLGGKSMYDIDMLEEERRRYGVSTAQQATDTKATNDDVYTGGDSPEALAKAAWLSMVNPDAIAGRSFGNSDGLTVEERREKEQQDAAFAAFLEDSFEAFHSDFQNFANEAAAVGAEVDAAVQEGIEARNLVRDELDKLIELRKQQEAEIKALESKISTASGTEREALEKELAELRLKAEQTEKLREAYGEFAANMTLKIITAKEEYQNATQNIDRIREEMKGASGDKLDALRLQLQEEQKKLDDAKRALADLKETSRLTSQTMAMARDGSLDQTEIMQLVAMSREDASFKGILNDLATQLTVAGVSVTSADGQVYSGAQGASYISKMLQIDDIDIQRARLEEQLTGDSVADTETNKKLTELAQQRLALEDMMGMCVMNKVENAKYEAAQAAAPADGPFVMKDNAGIVLATFNFGLTAGVLTMTAHGGNTYKFDELSAEDKRMVVDALKEGLADGQKLEPEVIAALKATEGVNMSVETIANNPPQPAAPAPAEVAAPAPAVDPALLKQQQAQAAQEQEMQLTAAATEAARVEQERLEKGAVERMMAGGNMSAEEYERMKSILGASYAAQLAEEHKVKVEQGILAEMGLGILKPGATTIGSFLFAGMAAQMAGREIASWQPESPFGIFGGNYRSFTDEPEFTAYNDPNAIDPSYLQPTSFASLAGLASMFGAGPASQQQQIQVQQPGTPTPAEQYRMQQEMLARLGMMTGPTAPNTNGTQQV